LPEPQLVQFLWQHTPLAITPVHSYQEDTASTDLEYCERYTVQQLHHGLGVRLRSTETVRVFPWSIRGMPRILGGA